MARTSSHTSSAGCSITSVLTTAARFLLPPRSHARTCAIRHAASRRASEREEAGSSPCRQGGTPEWRRAALAGAEDRCFSMPARAQLEPDEQERLDIDERARDPLNRPGGAGGAGREAVEAVPHRTRLRQLT